MNPDPALPAPRPRRWRGWLWLSLLANLLLGWWLWRLQPPTPPPAALAVGEEVVLRIPGGRLEVAELKQVETFEVSRDHQLLGVPVGSTFSRIRVPAHYRSHVELAPEWTVRVRPDGSVRVIAPRLQPTLPVAIDTGQMEKESRGLWSLFTGASSWRRWSGRSPHRWAARPPRRRCWRASAKPRAARWPSSSPNG